MEYVHEGKKGYECEVCSKSFVRKEDLVRHSVLHRDKKAHRCPICDKTFSIKPSLKVHLLTHTKVRTTLCLWVAAWGGTAVEGPGRIIVAEFNVGCNTDSQA